MKRRGTQAKTSCEYCGRAISASRLRGHVGNLRCTQRYWLRKLNGQYRRPKGTLPLERNEEEIACRLFRTAGFTPDTAPLEHRVVWEQHPQYPEYTPTPKVEALVPLWLGIVVKPLIPRYQDEGHEQAQRGILEQDVVTLLCYLNDRPAEALALAAELELVAGEDTRRGGRYYELAKVREVMRRWASEAADHATLPE